MIKLFLVDVDGCLTDGNYYMSETGAISKSFYSRDFHGMYMLSQIGVQVGIISMSSDKVINRQCDRAATYIKLVTGTKDKLASVAEEFSEYNSGEMAYMGDELIDIPLLKTVSLAACPRNAHPEVIKVVTRVDGLILNSPGGCGCVREFADVVMKINKCAGGEVR